MDYSWPEHYPENCPPEEADSRPGTYFRCISGNDVTEEDFESNYDMNLRRDMERTNPCARRSTSIWSTFKGARRILDLWPQFPSRCIAEVGLDGRCGQLKRSKGKERREHYHWWIPTNIDPCHFATGEVSGPY